MRYQHAILSTTHLDPLDYQFTSFASAPILNIQGDRCSRPLSQNERIIPPLTVSNCGTADEFQQPPAKRRRIHPPEETLIKTSLGFDRPGCLSRTESTCNPTHGCSVSPYTIRPIVQDKNEPSRESGAGPSVCEKYCFSDFTEAQLSISGAVNDVDQNYDQVLSHYDGNDTSDAADEEICFGMVRIAPFRLSKELRHELRPRSISVLDELHLNMDGSVIWSQDSVHDTIGTVSTQVFEILNRLQEQPGIEIQLRCVVRQECKMLTEKRTKAVYVQQRTAVLDAIIYGPFCAFDSIGDFLEACDIYLQDPSGCDRNVPYRNPHRLSSLDQVAPMTMDREAGLRGPKCEQLERASDYFEGLASHSNMPCAESPGALQTKLHQYQQQALYFMIERERGWNLAGDLDDVWKMVHLDGLPTYLNTIVDERQIELPPAFKGGLLADGMGLGKTLSMIALVASDLDQQPLTSSSTHCSMVTLVVVPPNLLDTWDFQLRQHCQPNKVRWSRHHDKYRFTEPMQLSCYNVILTTYNTVCSEWKRGKDNSVLFTVHWHRIILDEAHYVREERNQITKAICDLKAERRWAVTGTPIQNHLADFRALLGFLRVHPYNQQKNFEHDIVRVWKVDSEEAIRRLKKLVSHIGIRRTNDTICLPPRKDLLYTLQFSQQEKEIYDRIETEVMSVITQIGNGESTYSGLRRHAFQGLHLLRSICNFGTMIDTRCFNINPAKTSFLGGLDAQDVFQGLIASGVVQCTRCSCDCTVANSTTEVVGTTSADFVKINPIISQCEQLLCSNCATERRQDETAFLDWCGHMPSCPTHSVSTSKSNEVIKTSFDERKIDLANLPTKVKALLKDIDLHPQSKSVVFSTWRTPLSLISQALNASGIQHVRYDGEVKRNERTIALSRFRQDPLVKVLLITMSCGAVGLDLTVADRAYILEPQWNPTIEEQALARIHRMGQQKPVTTIRFVMAESVEKRVMEVQHRKKTFAELLLSSTRKDASSSKAIGTFAYLRNLLS